MSNNKHEYLGAERVNGMLDVTPIGGYVQLSFENADGERRDVVISIGAAEVMLDELRGVLPVPRRRA